MTDFLFNYAQHLGSELLSVSQSTFTNNKLNLICETLPLRGQEGDCREHFLLKPFFDPIKSVESPVVYWMEIISDHSAEQLWKRMQSIKKESQQSFPSIRKKWNDLDSRILYVGKSKTDLSGRMVAHLGYHRNQNTQGLQLCHWANSMKLILTLNYIVLPISFIDTVELFENELARKLKPVFGKHR